MTAAADKVVRPVLLGIMLASAVLGAVAFAQALVATPPAQTSVQAYAEWVTNELSRRVSVLEGAHATERLDARVSSLETDMTELKWLSRGVAIAIIGQFASAGFAALRRSNKP